ncbi:MAG: hypothetical protein US60_C0008G0051 [Microgenomates group bacterium GW2011_GWC1_37_8]|uniref:Uncharacterized protein n=1 Tax=Candidatus Woesebacteria bacterium GW2011_GWB1_38_8 TaxID=1618570 RepID=A0A0G0P983_9BACT|nr:MAG: hypothetical protein US60_C0008G0051 [Microgenomates group bacterium GW2011_GWC1_37_8]KKQ85886.1 MAG: hypothetical protein UT08_C0003G0049 [Candidatus Woesebacteria bacterium GW2011_GWB1_38_8]
MKELLEYILEGILANKSFVVKENTEDGRLVLKVILPEEDMGIVIGKGGQAIKSIQNILQIKGRLENKLVYINVESSKTN